MKLTLFIGPTEQVAMRFRSLFQVYEKPLRKAGVETPAWNHVRLYAACARAEAVGVLRHRRGLDHPALQDTLKQEVETLLTREIAQMSGDHVVLAAAQMGNLLCHPDEIARLHAILSEHFSDIRLIAHVEDPARMLAAHYAQTVIEGRATPLDHDLAQLAVPDWWHAAVEARADNKPEIGLFGDLNAPPFWLDMARFLETWDGVFGTGSTTLRPLDLAKLMSARAMDELAPCLDIPNRFDLSPLGPTINAEPAASLTRMRRMNDVLIRYAEAREVMIPHDVKSQIHKFARVPGDPIAPGSLSTVSERFQNDTTRLVARFPDLATAMTPDPAKATWTEADPTMGFRATQYLAAFRPMIDKNSVPHADLHAQKTIAARSTETFEHLLRNTEPTRRATLLSQIAVNHQTILSGPFNPHNAPGRVDEAADAPAFDIAPRADLRQGSTGTVAVACMKNEAPYIIEWIAYHRAIGVDNFLIYTNDCTDGTDAILQRLETMGVLQHRNNDAWKGKSPQQHALNQAIKEPLVKNADWLLHIDVDEFINIRTGNGTVNDLRAAVPEASHIAMTWRLFGHDGVVEIADRFVIDQFEHCAPRYCPKPHTVWGFKTMFRNSGAYAKMSCHRPTKLNPGFEDQVKWVNGSGEDMTRVALKTGWRSSKANIGYDLVQLNHYALRSAESFLIKRQRGRALHVDRTIGINYWIRMDWSDARDVSIKRNLPRLQQVHASLMADNGLRTAHEAGVAWHQSQAKALRATPEFATLFDSALEVDLTAAERAAYAMALDLES